MSWKRQDEVWTVTGLSAIEKLVLMALAHHENDSTGICCPSCFTLSKETGCSIRSVRYAIKSMKDSGLIGTSVAKTNKGIVNNYTFNLHMGGANLAQCANDAQCAIVAPPRRCDGSANHDMGSATVAPGVVQPLHTNRENITEKLTEREITTTTFPPPPKRENNGCGGGGDALAVDSSDDFDDFTDRLASDLLKKYGTVKDDPDGFFTGLSYLIFKPAEFRQPDGLYFECDVEKAIRAIYANGGKDESGAPIPDLFAYLTPFVRGEKPCFGFSMPPQVTELAPEAASAPSDEPERATTASSPKKRATDAPRPISDDSAVPPKPSKSVLPKITPPKPTLDGVFEQLKTEGVPYDPATVISSFEKLEGNGWIDGAKNPIRNPLGYLVGAVRRADVQERLRRLT